MVTVLRGALALREAARLANLPEEELQQRLARLTGNYRRGNERHG